MFGEQILARRFSSSAGQSKATIGSAGKSIERGPPLLWSASFGPVMEPSNSCGRIGGYSHAVDNQTAAFVLLLGAHVGVFVVT